MQASLEHLTNGDDYRLATILVLMAVMFISIAAVLVLGVYFEIRREDRNHFHGGV